MAGFWKWQRMCQLFEQDCAQDLRDVKNMKYEVSYFIAMSTLLYLRRQDANS
ncbi:hypothetical protein ACFL2H_08185 [Planctomycetota bacterium]